MMLKNYLLILLFTVLVICAKAQQQSKTIQINKVYEQLSAEQKVVYRNIHENYRKQMQALLNKNESPELKHKHIERLHIERDSSLRILLGEQLYEKHYRMMTPITSKTPNITHK